MSKFSLEYLNENVRVGFVESRGPAWWATTGQAVGSQFQGAVPLGEARNLFDWTPDKVALMRESEMDGSATPLKDYKNEAPVAVVRSDTGELLGIFNENYPATGYNERLLDGLSAILDTPDSDLSIGSCGLLDGGAKAFVQIESPDNIRHSTGEEFRPFLCAYSSLDGTLRTTFKEGVTRVVCDNTFDMFKREKGRGYAYKNTANSGLVVATAREALDLLHEMTADYMAELDSLTATPFSESQWNKALELHIPTEGKTGRGKTVAENRQLALSEIYWNDPRVGPFVGTVWGAFQAFSTHNQHATTVRDGDHEYMRNMRKDLSGKTFEFDTSIMATLGQALAVA